ncbi:MAG: class I adenylate-forming enzyme family protein [Alphaproteobacteria bacterium]|jgi:long-chain acyl-CoA synthetase|nr:class I adenylate-forming enzyme family protein [Alphaproteobacteria bacterium]
MKIASLLSQHAGRTPNKAAVIYGDDILTFGELDRQSNRMANALLAKGLRQGDRVILYVGNSLELVVAIAALWKAGALPIPITTWTVGRELAFLVSDSKPFAVLYGPEQTVEVQNAELPGDVMHIMTVPSKHGLDLEALIAAGDAAPPPPLPPQPDDAMIGYTSGTTGRPKGSIMTHANLITAQLLVSTYCDQSGDDIFMIMTPIAHRVGMARLVTCFTLGASVVVMPRFEAAAAVTLIQKHGITIISLVPTVARLLLEQIEATGAACPSLRAMTATGEAFPVALKERLAAVLPHVGLWVFYGMTEGGIPAALRPDEQSLKPTSVGRPMPGVEIRLTDEAGMDVQTGQPGEVLLRSGAPGQAMVAREYFNRPKANGEAYKDGWFRTGDVGRFDEDGYLYLVDRVKDMILSGGLNVYSREVEQALEAAPAVREVAVVAGPDEQFGECVVAYVALKPGWAATAEELIAHCRDYIAGYKKPKYLFCLDDLPRNVNGKVVKATLRERAPQDILGTD